MRLSKSLTVVLILFNCVFCTNTFASLSEQEVQQLKQLLTKSEKSTNQETALIKNKPPKDDSKNWSILNQFIDKGKSEISENIVLPIESILRFQQNIEQIQNFIETFQSTYDFTTESINKLSKQYQVLLENLLYQTCVCCVFNTFINFISPMLSSLDQTALVDQEKIDSILKLLSGIMQNISPEIMTKPLTNIFSLLQAIKENSHPNLPSVIMFSIIKTFPNLLNNDLQPILNDFKATTQVVTLETKAMIDKMASEKNSEKFSTDRKNITSCIITIMQKFLQELIQGSKIIIDSSNQIIVDTSQIQKLCKEAPKQDITLFVSNED